MNKHVLMVQRAEKELLGIDLAAELAEGETLHASPTVKIFDFDGNDVTSEFVLDAPGPSFNGTVAQFWKIIAADAAKQTKELYRIKITAGTSNGRTIVAQTERQRLPLLRVFQ